MPHMSPHPCCAAAYLKCEEECALYLQAVIEGASGDTASIDTALLKSARARNRLQLVAKAHTSHTSQTAR